MKNLIVLILLLYSCSQKKIKQTPSPPGIVQIENDSNILREKCWTATIDSNTHVLLHYSENNHIISGELTYLDAIGGKPIKVIGKIGEDTTYRILEFGKEGTIRGIITGKPGKEIFNGDWFSTKTRKKFQVTFIKKDTLIPAHDLLPNDNEIDGDYHYQYSEKGPAGDIEIHALKNNKFSFRLFCMSDLAGALAEVPKTTIGMNGNVFIYKFPVADSCEFRVTFYKGFAAVDYIKSYCDNFGDVYIDEIFLKK